MSYVFVKTVCFTRLIKAGGRLREFNFIRLGGNRQNIFDVDVVDNRFNRVMFKVQKDERDWHIIQQADLPEWVSNAETELREIILEEISAPPAVLHHFPSEA